MLSRITHIILLIACYLPVQRSGATAPPQTDNNLKEIVCRIATDITYSNSLGILDPVSLEEFYSCNQYSLQWFSVITDTRKRAELIKIISEPERYMLDPGPYHSTVISSTKKLSSKKDSLFAEIKFTDAALGFFKNIAYPTVPMVKYNGWKYQPDCTAIVSMLQQAINASDLEKYIKETEPENIQYRKLRSAYQKLYALSVEKNFHEIMIENKTVSTKNKDLANKLKQLGYMDIADTAAVQLVKALNRLQAAHNLPVQNTINRGCMQVLNETVKAKLKELRWNIRWFRWLNCMQNKSYILVNIAANRLTLFKNNEAILTSKIVVGKISTPTPTQTSVVQNAIYYPYWNVPFSIAVKEMLPKLKRDPHYLDNLKIEVLRGGHSFTSSSQINWHNYSRSNFPFNLRQLPGCHNSLGLLKFDFENPFHTYLHDTNNKLAFKPGRRFFSHGCIRIEKPYELAIALGIPAEQINMDSCLTGMKPQVIPLNRSIPIFIIYATVDIIDSELRWFEDAYHKREN